MWIISGLDVRVVQGWCRSLRGRITQRSNIHIFELVLVRLYILGFLVVKKPQSGEGPGYFVPVPKYYAEEKNPAIWCNTYVYLYALSPTKYVLLDRHQYCYRLMRGRGGGWRSKGLRWSSRLNRLFTGNIWGRWRAVCWRCIRAWVGTWRKLGRVVMVAMFFKVVVWYLAFPEVWLWKIIFVWGKNRSVARIIVRLYSIDMSSGSYSWIRWWSYLVRDRRQFLVDSHRATPVMVKLLWEAFFSLLGINQNFLA